MALFDNSECKTCKVLQETLEFERARNKELTETLTSLIKPQPIIQTNTTLQPVRRPTGITFSRRRKELETQDRLRIEAENSPLRARPDSEAIKKLEHELGVVDSEEKEGA